MAEEYETDYETQAKDGGVLLPIFKTIVVDHGFEASSAGSSSSMTSLSSTCSAQHLANGSNNSCPAITSSFDQENFSENAQSSSILSSAPQEADGALFSEAHGGQHAQTLELEEIAPYQYATSLAGSIGQDDTILDSNTTSTLYTPDPAPLEYQGNVDIVNIEEEDLIPAPFSSPGEQDLNEIFQIPTLVAHDEDAYTFIVFKHYLPEGKNHDIGPFLRLWRQLWLQRKEDYPCISDEGGSTDLRHRHGRVSVHSMKKASCDIQGIKWSHFQTAASQAREMRKLTSRNFINMPEINYEPPAEAYATQNYKACFISESSHTLPNTDRFFRFCETNLKYVPEFIHNQLRHNLSASSRNAVFFYNTTVFNHFAGPFPLLYNPFTPKVRCFNPETGIVSDVIDFFPPHDSGFPRLLDIACVNASDGMLIVGALQDGHFAMKSLSNTCDDTYIRGDVNHSGSNAGINHIHTFKHRRSGVPHAVFCDNDAFIRVIDCNTAQEVCAQKWGSLVNCSATSPSGRLRIHVSDDQWPIVAEAETGHILARLPGHKDHGFACDWSADGITMATGHQDGIVQVWDARKMTKAVHALPAEMGGVRSLHFSPLGSGHPVLVMAEPIDFVSIVDARTFQSKQDIEFFGEISGVSMPPDGDTLFIGNADPTYGGIIEFERTGYTGQFKHRRLRCSSLQQRKDQRRRAVYNASPEDSDCEDLVEEASPAAKLKRKWKLDDQDAKIWQTREHDWATDADMDNDGRAAHLRNQRWHRHLGLETMVF